MTRARIIFLPCSATKKGKFPSATARFDEWPPGFLFGFLCSGGRLLTHVHTLHRLPDGRWPMADEWSGRFPGADGRLPSYQVWAGNVADLCLNPFIAGGLLPKA